MAILILGGSGFLGQALTPLLLKKGHTVYSLSRHPPIGSRKLIAVRGDITKTDLGMDGVPEDITTVYHLAGVHTLRKKDKDGLIYESNVVGTRNVIEFCEEHKVKHLFFTSTAYTWGINPYGKSKIQNELDLGTFAERSGIKVTVFKPSIVMGTPEHPYPGHFSKFISGLIYTHQRAELVRRKIEGTMRLPVIEPLFRIKGNPKGKLNLVPVDAVVKAISRIKQEGTFWLTNPSAPSLSQLAEWVGEIIMVNLKFLPEFKATPIEAAFGKLTSPFELYLQGHDFRSDLKEYSPITKDFIRETVRRSISLFS